MKYWPTTFKLINVSVKEILKNQVNKDYIPALFLIVPNGKFAD